MTTLCMAVFAASFLGSLHCLGMCGGLVTAYSGQADSGRFAIHAVYNAARLLAYFALGAAAGAAGAAADLAGGLAGVGNAAAWVAGGCMILWGAVSIVRLSGWNPARFPRFAWLCRLLSRITGRFAGRPPLVRALILGTASALLPCGWLYAFVVVAGGTGNPLTGGLVMAAFWSGSVPALLGLGVGLRHLAGRVRRIVPWVSAAAVLAIGLGTIAYRARLRVHPSAAPLVEWTGTLLPAAPCCSGR